VVKKTSFLEKLKRRWRSGSTVRLEDTSSRAGSGEVAEPRFGREPDETERLDAPRVESKSRRKLSAKEEAVVVMGEGLRELSSLVRGVQSRVEDQGERHAGVADQVEALPELSRSQLEVLHKMVMHFERQNAVSERLLKRLEVLPELLSGVQEAIAVATATDQKTSRALGEFRVTMDRIEGSMEKMVESSNAQTEAAASLVRDRSAADERIVTELQHNRESLEQEQREGIAKIEAATVERLQAMRQHHAEHAERLAKMMVHNGRWTQVLVVLLCLTFFAIAGILSVLALP